VRAIQVKCSRALGTANEISFYSKRCSAKHRTGTFSAGRVVPIKEGDNFCEGGRELLTVGSRVTAPVGVSGICIFANKN